MVGWVGCYWPSPDQIVVMFSILMYIIIKGFNQYHLKRYGAWPRRILAAGILLFESKLLAVVEVTCLWLLLLLLLLLLEVAVTCTDNLIAV